MLIFIWDFNQIILCQSDQLWTSSNLTQNNEKGAIFSMFKGKMEVIAIGLVITTIHTKWKNTSTNETTDYNDN